MHKFSLSNYIGVELLGNMVNVVFGREGTGD